MATRPSHSFIVLLLVVEQIEKSGVIHADQPLARILAAVEAGDGAGGLFEAVQDLLAIVEAPLADPGGQLRYGLLVAMLVIPDQEALHARCLVEQVPLDARTF